jgi:hypothetical protein
MKCSEDCLEISSYITSLDFGLWTLDIHRPLINGQINMSVAIKNLETDICFI